MLSEGFPSAIRTTTNSQSNSRHSGTSIYLTRTFMGKRDQTSLFCFWRSIFIKNSLIKTHISYDLFKRLILFSPKELNFPFFQCRMGICVTSNKEQYPPVPSKKWAIDSSFSAIAWSLLQIMHFSTKRISVPNFSSELCVI